MAERTYSLRIVGAINECFTNEGWHYSYDEEMGKFEMRFGLKNDLDHVDIRIYVYDKDFSVRAYPPVKVRDDPAKRKEMAEFVTRANYGLNCGRFEYDIRDGEIGYKVFTICNDIVPSEAMVRRSVNVAVGMIDRYAPGIAALLYGGATAEEAVAKCEEG